MMKFFKKWFRSLDAHPPGPGRDTRHRLESGIRHLHEGRTACGREERCRSEHDRATRAFETAFRRRPDLPQAEDGRIAGLCDTALCAMERGQEAPAEWLSALRVCGRRLAREPRCVVALRARAVLYLAAACRLRFRRESARSSLTQAVRDLDDLPAQASVDRELRRIIARLWIHQNELTTEPTSIAEVRAVWAQGAVEIV